MSRRRAVPVLLLRLACIALAGVAIALQAAAGAPCTSLSLLVGYATLLCLSTWMSWSSATGGRIPFLLMCGDLAALAAVGVLGGPGGALSDVFASAYLVATLVGVVSRSGRGVRVQGLAGPILVAALAGMLVLLVGIAASSGLAAGEHLHLAAWIVLILAAVIEGTVLTAWVMIDVQTRATQSDRMRTLGQTLSGVTHELDNPLAALMGFADLVQGVGDEVRRDYLLTRIRDQAGRASKIVRRLRRFITVQNQNQTTSFEIHGSLDAVIQLFAYEARKNKIDVKLTRSPRLHSVRAERHPIEQVFVNGHRTALRELTPQLSRRVILMTGDLSNHSIVLSAQESGTPRLLKPFRPGELGDAIQEVLERFPFSPGGRELRVMRAAALARVSVS